LKSRHATDYDAAMSRAVVGARAGWHPLVLVPLALTAWVYLPIVGTFFFADDFVHLTEIASEGPLLFLFRPFGGQAFLGRNLVFLATYKAFGADPVSFMWTVLLTHLLNVALFFGVIRAFTRSPWLACFGAALWGMSPLVAGTLDWYAAFGHVLVGTLLLVVLRGVAEVVNEGGPIPRGWAVVWYVALLVGTTCYGPGMGLAGAFPVALLLLLPGAWRQRGVRWAFLAMPVAVLVVYFGLRRVYGFIGELPVEELFQQQVAFSGGFGRAPVLFFYLLLHSSASAVLGPFMPRVVGAEAAPWIAAGVLTVAVLLVLWRADWPTRRAAVAMAALWGGTLLAIALGRANLFAVFHIEPPEAASSGRYHYAAAIPLILLICLVLQQLARLRWSAAVPRPLVVGVLLGVLAYGHATTASPVDQHRAAHDYFLTTQREIANAVAAAPPGAPVYLENRTSPVYVLGGAIPERLFPGRAGVFLLSGASLYFPGRDIRFVERDPVVLEAHRGTLIGWLLVAPEQVPPSVQIAG
jgi:hypothetical protein